MTEADHLFAAHRHQVFRYLSRIVGHADAGELTQEVFLRVVRTLEAYQTSLDNSTALFLGTDSDFYRYLRQASPRSK